MGRDKKTEQRAEHFTKLMRNMMETPAWGALTSSAQALYPWIRLEWRGAANNNNGKMRLTVSQAAKRMGIADDTAMRAFHDLQAKGFLVVIEEAQLGVGGEAKSPTFELTEIGYPKARRDDNQNPGGRKLYQDWREGSDFPVVKAKANNPQGRNGKTKPQPKNWDGAIPKNGMEK